MKKQIRKSYTLVEIMMVIVIAAILFGIGIPAFSTMIQGNSMTIAIRQLSAKISAARAYAVMNRCKVALLLVCEDGAKADYRHSAYRVCVVEGNSDNTAFSFDSWIEDENWKTLPKGILLNNRNSDFKDPTDPKKNNYIQVDSSEIGGQSNSNIPALIFNTNGQLLGVIPTELKLVHGRYIDDAIRCTDTQNDVPGTQPLTVNRYTGKVSVGEFTYDKDK